MSYGAIITEVELGYQVPFPQELQQIEYVKLFFHLKMVTSLKLPALALLQLRRELFQALKTFPESDAGFLSQIQQLLNPSLPIDPIIQRRVQKPAPALVISPLQLVAEELLATQTIVLPVFFIGSGTKNIDAFIKLLHHLGSCGLINGRGNFYISSIGGEDGSGYCSSLEFNQNEPEKTVFPVNSLQWWLERREQLSGSVQIELLSPARLIKHNRPLFRAKFIDIFPFILRRVTALIVSHAGVEFRHDVAGLLSIATTVEGVIGGLVWHDWRTLKCDAKYQSLGGLLGTISLDGDGLQELLWILQLGTLFNCGKGAAYGAGQYRLNCA